jgi:hypothetical protein
MKKQLVLIGVFTLGVVTTMVMSGFRLDTAATAADDAPGKRLRHVVLFKFKEDATEAQVRQVEKAFGKLPQKVNAIVDFEWGTDISVEGLSEGFTHCFLVSFRDKQGRDAYLPHPAHEEFVKMALPLIDKALVVDYWVQK